MSPALARIAARHDAEDRAEKLTERGCELLVKLLRTGTIEKLVSDGVLDKSDSVTAVEVVAVLLDGYSNHDGYLIDDAGEFVEPGHSFQCSHVTKTCYHGTGCPCGGDECAREAVAVDRDDFPLCEAHR